MNLNKLEQIELELVEEPRKKKDMNCPEAILADQIAKFLRGKQIEQYQEEQSTD